MIASEKIDSCKVPNHPATSDVTVVLIRSRCRPYERDSEHDGVLIGDAELVLDHSRESDDAQQTAVREPERVFGRGVELALEPTIDRPSASRSRFKGSIIDRHDTPLHAPRRETPMDSSPVPPALDVDARAEAAKQRHDYLRHLYQQLVSWFSIFAAMNYASMGWLATKDLDSATVRLVAALFIGQNALSVGCCLRVGQQFMRLHGELAPVDRVPPVRTMHRETILLMAGALSLILAAWVWILLRPPT